MPTPYSDSEALFRDLFDNAPVGYHEVEPGGRLVRVNKTEAAMLGYTPEEMVGRFAWEFVVEKISRHAFAAKIAGTQPLAQFERTFRRKDGSHVPVMLEERLLYDDAGKVWGIRTTVFDITARKQAEQALRESEERHRQLVELAPDAILVHCQGRFVFANSAAVQLFGAAQAEDLLGRRVMDFVHPDSRELIREQDRKIREEQVAVPPVEQKVVRLDGSPVDVEVSAMPFVYHQEPAVQVVIHDITLRKLAEEQIRSLAYHDVLTGLPNRILFNDRLAMAAAQAHRQKHKVALLFLDLDRFKAVNDSMGHVTGDRLLQAVAKRVQSCVREGDTVSRHGGDEFALLLPGLQQSSDAVRAAEKVLTAIRQPFRIDGRELFITASVGISIYPDDARDVETLLKDSDVAMYRVKEQGRDNYQLFSAEVEVCSSERWSLESRLRSAIDHNQLVVFYQPVVAAGDFAIRCCEALLRWDYPDLGLVLPDEFLPLAEANGLIVPIGAWVLRTACEQTKTWQAAGHTDLCVSVNLSARQLQHARLVDDVRAALENSGLDGKYLELEIGERTVTGNTELTLAILREIAALGVRISLDNFGTGDCSLRQMRQLPITSVKLDRSLVASVTSDPDHDSTAIAAAAIAMAHSLGLQVVGTGAETADQIAFLSRHSCDAIQGFCLGGPLPAEQLAGVLSAGVAVAPSPESASQ